MNLAEKYNIRSTMRGDEELFYFIDICEALEIERPSRALVGLDPGDVISAGPADGNIDLITEMGLYCLAARSKSAAGKEIWNYCVSLLKGARLDG
jgi:prophage antirepressor-like protein